MIREAATVPIGDNLNDFLVMCRHIINSNSTNEFGLQCKFYCIILTTAVKTLQAKIDSLEVTVTTTVQPTPSFVEFQISQQLLETLRAEIKLRQYVCYSQINFGGQFHTPYQIILEICAVHIGGRSCNCKLIDSCPRNVA